MNDLELYHDLKKQILELKAEITKLEREKENAIKLKSYWRLKYQKLKNEDYTANRGRCKRAIEMLKKWHDGDKSKTLKQIADECCLAYSSIRTLSSKYKKASKNETTNGFDQ